MPNDILKLSLPLHVSYDVDESDDEKVASTKVMHAEVDAVEDSD
jgi:hypothetical protein